jgi:hypothetical protein
MKRAHAIALVDFVASLEALGFAPNDDDQQVCAADTVDVVNQFFAVLQEAAHEVES